MSITRLGRQLVAPEEEGADVQARREAVLAPRISKEFFEKYRRAKFPTDQIAMNVLRSMGLPQDRAEAAIQILKENGRYSGIICDTPTGLFINLDSPSVPLPNTTPLEADQSVTSDRMAVGSADLNGGKSNVPLNAKLEYDLGKSEAAFNNRVFITHGKDRQLVTQIKELLSFGKFEPIVSVERESTAIPVPDKVFEDMRACSAGVIHVGGEGKYMDSQGNELTKINDNVLIEIGAAMALYGKKVILLVEKGVTLPSNLQGLYRCEFEGGKLDYDSTMKLLKTFNQFR